MREELDAPPLDRRFGAESALRINIPLGKAIVGGIGEDQDSGGSALLGVIDLQATKDLAVADQDDLVLDVDPQLLQGGVIVGTSVIGVDHLTGRPPRRTVSVEGAERLAAGGILVGRDGCLVHRQVSLHGKPERQWPGSPQGIVQQHLHLDQIGLPAPFSQLVPDEDRRLVIGLRTGDVGLGGQDAEPSPRALGRGDRQGVGLRRTLLRHCTRRESNRPGRSGRAGRLRGLCRRSGPDQDEKGYHAKSPGIARSPHRQPFGGNRSLDRCRGAGPH